jgi:hypothetical protein
MSVVDVQQTGKSVIQLAQLEGETDEIWCFVATKEQV